MLSRLPVVSAEGLKATMSLASAARTLLLLVLSMMEPPLAVEEAAGSAMASVVGGCESFGRSGGRRVGAMTAVRGIAGWLVLLDADEEMTSVLDEGRAVSRGASKRDGERPEGRSGARRIDEGKCGWAAEGRSGERRQRPGEKGLRQDAAAGGACTYRVRRECVDGRKGWSLFS